MRPIIDLLPLLEFIFQSFWTWSGTVFLILAIAVFVGALAEGSISIIDRIRRK